MPRHREADRKQIKRETRKQLLRAATEEFAREGYDGGNVNRISRAAGFAKGTVYNYFSSKQALMLALIDEVAGGHFAYVAERVRAEADPARRLARFFKAGFAWVTEHLDQARVMVSTLNGPHAALKSHMFAAYGPMFELVAVEIVGAGVEEGVYRPADPVQASRLLMTIYLGVCSQLNEQRQPWFTPTQVTDLLLNGLLA
jgi:AcrR family transcriptional regulator